MTNEKGKTYMQSFLPLPTLLPDLRLPNLLEFTWMRRQQRRPWYPLRQSQPVRQLESNEYFR